MRNSVKVVAAGLAGLTLGAIAGALAGFELSSRTWDRMSRPLLVATGNQAYNALILIESNRTDELRSYLEVEVDSALSSIQAMEAKGQLASGDPIARLNDRLVAYRRDHPHPTPPSPAAGQ